MTQFLDVPNMSRWIQRDGTYSLATGGEADIVVDDPGVSRRHLEIRVTPAGHREGHVHDVIITKEAPNYRVE